MLQNSLCQNKSIQLLLATNDCLQEIQFWFLYKQKRLVFFLEMIHNVLTQNQWMTFYTYSINDYKSKHIDGMA